MGNKAQRGITKATSTNMPPQSKGYDSSYGPKVKSGKQIKPSVMGK